jgi:hypothetical protein
MGGHGMYQTEQIWVDDILKDLQEHYPGVVEVLFEEESTYCVYADDDTLWKMYDELANFFQTVEFNAGDQERRYLRVVLKNNLNNF